MHAGRKSDAVEFARHIDIGDDRGDLPGKFWILQKFESLGSTTGFARVKAGFRQNIGTHLAHEHIVLNDENAAEIIGSGLSHDRKMGSI